MSRRAVRLCRTCQKRYAAILKAYGIERVPRDPRSLTRQWAQTIKEGLNGLCWCVGGKCKGTSLPPWPWKDDAQ